MQCINDPEKGDRAVEEEKRREIRFLYVMQLKRDSICRCRKVVGVEKK